MNDLGKNLFLDSPDVKSQGVPWKTFSTFPTIGPEVGELLDYWSSSSYSPT